jgi:hypothetical protein
VKHLGKQLPVVDKNEKISIIPFSLFFSRPSGCQVHVGSTAALELGPVAL